MTCNTCHHQTDFGLCSKTDKYPTKACEQWKKQRRYSLWITSTLLIGLAVTFVFTQITLWGSV